MPNCISTFLPLGLQLHFLFLSKKKKNWKVKKRFIKIKHRCSFNKCNFYFILRIKLKLIDGAFKKFIYRHKKSKLPLVCFDLIENAVKNSDESFTTSLMLHKAFATLTTHSVICELQHCCHDR